MADDIYLIYFCGKFIGMLTDSESFWYLYEWLSDSEDPVNVVTVDKDMLDMPQDVKDFNKMVSRYGEVTLERSKMCIRLSYDDNLI